MKFEIERKFLVDEGKWKVLAKRDKQFVQQGYLLTTPDKTIRVRLTSISGYLTIKGLSVGATRKEFEYEIPKNDAQDLLNNFCDCVISKTRYQILHDGNVWEVDEFLNENLGLIVAEIELESEDQEFRIPDWVGKEVTGDEKYYNSNLSVHPFKNW